MFLEPLVTILIFKPSTFNFLGAAERFNGCNNPALKGSLFQRFENHVTVNFVNLTTFHVLHALRYTSRLH